MVLAGGIAAAVSASSPASADAPLAYDGSQSSQAAPSCWAIIQANPATPSGVYWLQTPTLVTPTQFYCDMTTDGGGWVLVGRGRDGWTWSDGGQGTQGDLRNIPSGTGAFRPATLPSKTVDGLLDGGRVDALADGVRVVRATDPAGATSQDMRIALSNRSSWSWAIGGGEQFSQLTIGTTSYGSGNTQSWGKDNQFLRLTTNEQKSHNYAKGFSFGNQVAGQNSPTSYLWTYTTENSAEPFTQVYLRPKITSVNYPSIPDSGLPANTLSPLESSTTAPTPWGVTGVVGGGIGEFNIEVEAMTYIGRTMYVGGKFQYVQQGAAGQKITQSYLAGFDVDTGAWVSSFRPVLDGTVWDLQAMADGNLLVGGEFTSVNSAANTTAIAEVNPTTGSLVPTWKSHVTYTNTRGDTAQVKAIDVQDGWAYLGGRFNHIYNGSTVITVSSAARVKVSDGTPDGTWKPHFDGSIVDLDASAQGDRVYMAGYFNTINGVSSPDEGAVSTATGAPFVTGLALWVPSTGSKARYQQTIREFGDYVWQGGSEHILSQYDRATYTRQHSVITKNGGDFQAVTEINGVIYAGCHCGNYVYSDTYNYSSPISDASDVHSAKYIVAIDAATGQPIPDFWPSALDTRAGNGAWELQPDPNGCLWFGGDFTQGSYVNGANQWLGGFGKFCPRDITAPTVPQNVKAAAISAGVKVTWTASTDNSGTAPKYEVLRGDRVIGLASGTSYTDTTATMPAKYWVRAIDTIGNRSATSSAVTVNAPDTSAPTVSVSSPADGAQVFGPTSVAIDASDDTGVSSVSLSVDGSVVGTDSTAPYSFSWNAVAQGSHTLQASAVDAAGNVGRSAVVSVTVPADTSAPSAPSGLAASNVTSTSVNLSWSAATDDRGVTGYQVLRAGAVVASTPGLTATDSGLSPGGSYSYTVRAVDAAGNVSGDSNVVSVNTPSALYSDSFTRADGSAWPAAWTTSTTGGSATVQSNAGELQFSDAANAYARAQLTGLAPRADSDTVLSYQWNSTSPTAYLSVTARGSGGWQNSYRPKTGYGIQLQSNSAAVTLQKTVAGTTTTLQRVSSGQQVSTAKQWLRLRVQGSTIEFKTWLATAPEPSAWSGVVNDTSISTPGQLFLSNVRGTSNVGAKSYAIDDVTVSDAS